MEKNENETLFPLGTILLAKGGKAQFFRGITSGELYIFGNQAAKKNGSIKFKQEYSGPIGLNFKDEDYMTDPDEWYMPGGKQ